MNIVGFMKFWEIYYITQYKLMQSMKFHMLFGVFEANIYKYSFKLRRTK